MFELGLIWRHSIATDSGDFMVGCTGLLKVSFLLSLLNAIFVRFPFFLVKTLNMPC